MVKLIVEKFNNFEANKVLVISGKNFEECVASLKSTKVGDLPLSTED
jgi:hypothetical protein